jgi:hypothetical protein
MEVRRLLWRVKGVQNGTSSVGFFAGDSFFPSDTFADDAESPVRFAARITGDSKYNAISLDTYLLFRVKADGRAS